MAGDAAGRAGSVAADENRLQQILHNLVGNAVKFTESGTVEISARVDRDSVAIRVTDTGSGIPLDRQEQIFGAFEQGDASTEREFGGTGLGLAVTRQLVELHGGTVAVNLARPRLWTPRAICSARAGWGHSSPSTPRMPGTSSAATRRRSSTRCGSTRGSDR